MYYNNQVFINDTLVAIPFDTDKGRMAIIRDLERKRNKGFKIKGIEVDDKSGCVIYSEPNKESLSLTYN